MLVKKVLVEKPFESLQEKPLGGVQLSYVQLPAYTINAMCIQLRTDKIGLKREIKL
jgi:hypothetical protein